MPASIKSMKKFYFKILPNIFILSGLIFILLSFLPLIVDEAWYSIINFRSVKYSLTDNVDSTESVFGSLLSSSPIFIEPVNKDFSLVIEKLGVNVPVIRDVSVTDEKAYNEALKLGVAQASASQYPSNTPGNTYLFAHASLNFWKLGKYSTVFNLLRKLSPGDNIHVFYEGKQYVYETTGKEVLKGWNTYPLLKPAIEPILTLQTCDPPGTTINRLIVTAKLKEIIE